jgi:7,8-dihydro-6-hydroxymethylpterin-pyrophosphokinase
MQERAFALLPLQEVRPNWEHPIFEKTIGQLVAELPEFECVKVGY